MRDVNTVAAAVVGNLHAVVEITGRASFRGVGAGVRAADGCTVLVPLVVSRAAAARDADIQSVDRGLVLAVGGVGTCRGDRDRIINLNMSNRINRCSRATGILHNHIENGI